MRVVDLVDTLVSVCSICADNGFEAEAAAQAEQLIWSNHRATKLEAILVRCMASKVVEGI